MHFSVVALTPAQIEVECTLGAHDFGRVHRSHHEVVVNIPEVVEDGLGVIDHRYGGNAAEDHLTQLQEIAVYISLGIKTTD